MGVEVYEANIKSTDISYSSGIGIRVFLEQKPGISYTERFTKESIFQMLEDAISIAKLSDPLPITLPSFTPVEDIDFQTYNENLQGVVFDDLVNISLQMEKECFELDSRIENVPYIGASKSFGESIFQNSNNVFYHKKINSISAYAGVTAKQNEQKKMGYFGNTFKEKESINPTQIAKTAVERGVELLGASPIPSGRYPVVFSNRVSASILGMFLSSYNGEAVLKGLSRLEGKVGQKIASSEFTMICDPHIVKMPGSRLFDAEGVPTRRKEFVSNGVLIHYLHNLESAYKFNTQPTGNGSRSYSGKAGTSVTNLIVPLGKFSLEDLLKVHPRCVLITKLEGASGCSAVSGDISIGVQGFLYEKGEKLKPFDKVTLNTNYFDMIQRIEGFSNEYQDVYTSIKVPDFLVSECYLAS
ncbi:MAG: TldD/PmbA family protein [Candidatus Pacearchaeota archaeon]